MMIPGPRLASPLVRCWNNRIHRQLDARYRLPFNVDEPPANHLLGNHLERNVNVACVRIDPLPSHSESIQARDEPSPRMRF
jgi:hypothetical protein